MDIVEFFQLSSGKWFSQRSSHNLTVKQTESGKSDFQVELLAKTDPAVIKLCEQYEIDPALALCGARVIGDEAGTQGKAHTVHTVLVPIATPNKSNEGKLLRGTGTAAKVPAGRYVISSDEVLTLVTENETMYAEERLWFANPNFRLRTSLLKRSGDFSMAAFYTEIRKGVTSPPAETKAQPSIEQTA